MAEFRNVIGEVFSMLTIIDNAPSRREPSGKLVKRIIVKCECGVEKDVAYKELKRGSTKSCGCLNESKKRKVTDGQKFGLWTAIRETEGYFDSNGDKSDRTYLCICVCGKEKDVNLNSLFSGMSKSCGCQGIIRQEKIKKEKIIPQDTEEEQWRESLRKENRYISTLGNTFDYPTQKYGKGVTITEMAELFIEDFDKSVHSVKLTGKEKNLKNIKITPTKTEDYNKLATVHNGIMIRCYSKVNKSYPTYGGKGIILEDCLYKFEDFYEWAINNGYKQGLEIDRIDSDKNYTINNCQFITKTENNLKSKKINLTLEDVRWIRSEEFTLEKALEKFTASEYTIKNIREYRTFKDVI